MNTLRGLGAERVLVLQGPTPLTVRASYGITEDSPWDEQISLSLLEQTLGEGSSLLLGDAQVSPFSERWSLAVSEIRSVLCVPFWSPSSRIVGVLYADTRSRAGVFTKKAMETVQACARKLEQALYGTAGPAPQASEAPPTPVARSPASGSLNLRPAAALQPQAAVATRDMPMAAERSGTPQSRALTIFFRSLSTMTTAGLPLNRSLEILGRQSEDKVLSEILRGVSRRVLGGMPLSAAFSYYPKAFSRFETQVVRLGEKSGSLHLVLNTLAVHREKSHDTNLKIKSALAYPALILVFCLALLLIGPPYLLEAQFRLIRESGQPIPALTQALMLFADFLRSPVGLPLLAASAIGIALTLRSAWRNPVLRERMHRRALRWPALGPALRTLATARFARSLGLTYKVGIPLSEGLVLAGQSTEDPILENCMGTSVEALKNGATLTHCLTVVDYFPKLFLHVVEAASEAGKVDELMEWTARLYEVELESALDSYLAMLEPLLMLGMGILVALVLTATMMPMLGVLQTL